MTQPTQAQVEAAVTAFKSTTGYYGRKLEEGMKAALTAAAQVGEQDWQRGYEAGMKSAAPAIAVLQADVVAAQFGEQKQEVRHIILTQDATLERCAQVAERYAGNIGEIAFTIATELRKLKDAP